MKKLKIGIVGARRGADLTEHFKSADNAALAAVCNSDETALSSFKNRFPDCGAKFHTSYDELLNDDIDTVILANYATGRAQLAINALNCKKHVISEVLPAETLHEAACFFFMGTAYGISSIIFLFVFILRNGKEKILLKNQTTSPAALFFTSAAAGIGSCVGNGILSYLCTKINGGILYPFINGGLCVTVAIFSFAIFREKADKLKILSLITGIAAIILLNI